jgi:glutamate synthase domain-containing protein 2
MGKDCISPASHTAFTDVSSMLDFIERLADATGLPVGIKSAVGEMEFWHELARRWRPPAAPPTSSPSTAARAAPAPRRWSSADHVALPFKLGFASVYRAFAERGLHEKVVFIGSGKLGFPAAGAARAGAGLRHGQRRARGHAGHRLHPGPACHTGHCPTGVATQNRWLVRGLDPTLKAARLANYLIALRKETAHLAHACGEVHPALVPLDRLDIVDGLSTPPGARGLRL